MSAVSDTLNRAADLIQERGWRTDVDGWGESGDGPLCVEGAIVAAVGGVGAEDVTDVANTCLAGAAVREYLSLPAYSSGFPADVRQPLWWWNDAVDRDVERAAAEVIEVLRATALIEAARERNTAEVSR